MEDIVVDEKNVLSYTFLVIFLGRMGDPESMLTT